MPGSHDSSRHSSIYRSPSVNDQDDSGCDHMPAQTIPEVSLLGIDAALQRNVPGAERNQYSNKESIKVNVGLTFSHDIITIEDEENPQIPVYEVTDTSFDFSELTKSIVVPEPKPSLERLVYHLLHPPAHVFIYGVLSFQWVLGVLGMECFHFRREDERYVLSDSSELRHRGAELGLPALYLEWLCGNDRTTSATEQSMLLTPRFFEQIWQERF